LFTNFRLKTEATGQLSGGTHDFRTGNLSGPCGGGKLLREYGDVLFGYHGYNVDNPAYAEYAACDNPDNADDEVAPQNAVDALNKRIKEDGEDKIDAPPQIVDSRFCHAVLLVCIMSLFHNLRFWNKYP
jgi:hypothetical protein